MRSGARTPKQLAEELGCTEQTASAVAAAVIVTRPDAQTAAVAGVACANAPTTDPNLAVIAADGRSPVDACAELWRTGQIRSDSVDGQPQLTPCVSEAGGIVVYPAGTGVCEDLGLTSELPAGFEATGRQMNEFRRAVADRLAPVGTACPTVAEATGIAEGLLSRSGLGGWSVQTVTDGVGECASFGLDAQRRVVTVSPLPR